jgi:putative transposase
MDSPAEVFVFEDLKVKNMTRAPKPEKSAGGTYIANGSKAKAGLNKSILESAWGKVKLFTAYKASQNNKLVIAIPPHGTSQECSKCSHTHPDNRKGQAVFDCQSCGFTENADTNASIVLKRRGIEMLVSGKITVKHRKRAMRLRKKETLGREPAEVTRGERHIRKDLGTTQGLHASMIRETPTATM